jgi:hypothetical protein
VLPLLREPGREERLDARTPAERERIRLREERDAALAALRDLEFDHRTGKIADDDYASLVGEHRRRVARALQALDGPAPANGSDVRGARAGGGGPRRNG